MNLLKTKIEYFNHIETQITLIFWVCFILETHLEFFVLF